MVALRPLRAPLRGDDRRGADLPLRELTARLDRIRRLQALAQNGLRYAAGPFDVARWEEVRAIAAELAASPEEDAERLVAAWSAEAGHATPKLDVRGVVARDETVLLVHELADDGWTLPGGFAEVGESPRQAVEKEVREESGFVVRAERVLAILNRDARDRPRYPIHGWKVYVLCTEVEPGEPDGVETDAAAFFAEDALPPLSEKTPPAHLARIFGRLRDPSHAAELD